MKKLILTLLWTLSILLPIKSLAQTPEPYAVLSEENTVLTFYYDDKKTDNGGMSVGPFINSEARGWGDSWSKIQTVVFDASMANCNTITSTAYWFYGCNYLTTIEHIEYLKTDNVTDMSYMFWNCSGLTSLNVTGFNTENVTNMSHMFSLCSNLTSLDVSSFKTQNVTNMYRMFKQCSGLLSLDLSSFKTDNVTNMNEMFYYCSSLTSLDLSTFNTSSVTHMQAMFFGCSDLTTIYASKRWNTDAVTNSISMFSGCTKLVGGNNTSYNSEHLDVTYARIDGENGKPGYLTYKDVPEPEPYAVLSEGNTVLTFYYDDQKAAKGGMSVGPFTGNYDPNSGQYVDDDRGWYDARESITTVEFDESFKEYTDLTSTAYWFNRCHNLSSIKHIEYLNTGKVEDMMAMFYECSSLTDLDVKGFDTGNAVNLQYMFYGCDGLTSLDVSGFNTSKVQIFFQMFAQCTGLASLDVSGFNTESAVYMNYMFSGCSSLTALDVSGFDTGNVTDMGFMFNGCSKLTALDVSGFDTGNVTSMEAMFANCSGLTSLDVTKFDTEKVTTMYAMFYGCSSLTELNLQNFKTANVKNLNMMFQFCSGLTSLDVSKFNTGNAENISQMFCKCSGLTSLDLSNFNTEKVTKMSAMFSECSALTSINLSSFNTSAIADIYGLFNMFYGCSSLTTLDLSSFNTSTVDNMTQMFFNCGNLETIYVGDKWTTENVTSSDDMFTYCYNLKGGQGTTYDAGYIDAAYAHIDEGATNPGYLTYKAPVDNWVTNGDFEGNDYQSFGNKKNGEEVLINVVDADIVVDDDDPANHCLHIISDGYGANYAWDNQFFIRLHDVVPVGSTVKLSLRAKASEAVTATIEAQAAPFTWLSGLSSIDITPQWNTSVQEFVVGEQQSGFQTYAIHLAVPEKEIDYYFDDIVVTVTSPSNNEPYAVLEGATLTFYYDDKKGDRGGMDVGPFQNYADERGWHEQRNNITNVVIDASMANYTGLTSTHRWFEGFSNLTSIIGLENLKMDGVTITGNMFDGCSSLTSLDLSSWNTENVTYLGSMFYNCSSLKEINLSGWKVGSVTYMNYMFSNCSSLVTIYVDDNWMLDQTGQVTGWQYVFNGCESLVGGNGTLFDANHIDTGYAHIDGGTANPGYFTDISLPQPYAVLSEGNTKLTFYYDNQKFVHGGMSVGPYTVNGNINVDEREWADNMLDITSVVFDPSFADCETIISTEGWFSGFENLQTITGLEYLNTSNVTTMFGMFYKCSSLSSLDVTHFETKNVTNFISMFQSCSGLTNLDVRNFDTSNATTIGNMFGHCYSLESLDLSSFNTAKVEDISWLFVYDSSLKVIYVGNGWTTENVTASTEMFWDNQMLVGGAGTTYNSTQVHDYTYAHIDEGPTNPGYFTYKEAPAVTEAYAVLSEGNTVLTFYYDNQKATNSGMSVGPFSSVGERGWHEARESIISVVFDPSFANYTTLTSTANWFLECNLLQSITGFEYLKTDNVTDMTAMFALCSSLKELDLSTFNTAKVVSMHGMFANCEELTTIYVGNGWSTASIVNGNDIFIGCTHLKGGMGTEYTQERTGVAFAHIDGGENNPGLLTDKNAPVVLDEIMAYGVLTDQMKKMTLYYDKNMASHTEGMTLPWGELLNGYEYNHARETLVTIDIDPSFANFNTLESSGYIFAGCMKLTAIHGLQYFVTDHMTKMQEMFASCESLTELDLSSFNTSHVTEMFAMFQGCSHLKTIIVGPGWTTAALTDEGHEMFAGCTSLVGEKGTTYSEPNFNADYAHIDGGPSNPGYLTGTGEQIITEFEVNGIVYRVRHQQSEHQVMVAHVIHAEEELYVPSEVPYANIHWHVTALAEKAFTDLHETKAIDIPESIDSISVDLFNHCPHLAAITWRTNVALTAAAMGEFNNPNLLLFLPDVTKVPANVTNVVDLETRIAEKIVLTDATNGGNDFYCPEPVKATQISYTHSYDQATKIGTCQGWESIVVPFDVETYTHETKGDIYPIASLLDEQIEYDGDKPFWLYEFTQMDEFVEADQIRANRPYIISMPNDPDYWDSYILTGRITFSAKNAEIYPTHEPMVVESKSRVFVPNYANADYQNPDVFLLNVGDAYDGHLPGSVFSSERPNRIARPFEAYFVPTGNYPAKRYMDIFDTEVDAIREIPMAAKAKEGIYDLTGRKVEDGQLTKGVYIIDGKKVMVK